MKNNLWIILISVVITLSSCITAAQFNNAEDDVYYSPKTSNRKEPVMIPEVDIDEIIRQNPPKYGEPTNRLDEEYDTNPMAAMYYPAYRNYQADTTYLQNPRVSTYIDPSLASEKETQEAEYLRHMYGDNSSYWDAGMSMALWRTMFAIGYSSYNNSYYNNCNPYYYPYGYSSYGYNNYCNPYYYGGYYYQPSHNNPDHGNSNTNTSISRPRPTVGRSTPPPNTSGGRNIEGSSESSTNGKYVAPALPGRANQPSQGRANTTNYTPAAPQQSLENVNGRQVYSRPVEPVRPEPKPAQNNPTPASSTRKGRSNGGSAERSNSSPTYNAPSQNVSTPSNSGRSNSSSQGSGRGSGSSSSGQTSGGRRR